MNHNAQKLSKRFYLTALAVSVASTMVLGFYIGMEASAQGPAAFQDKVGLLLLPVIPGVVLILTLWFKMWASIQDGHARTTPGKAIGLLFVPVFNLFWIFQVLWGFAKDYNGFLDRHRLFTPKLPEKLFLAYPILCFTTWIPVIGLLTAAINGVILFVLVAKICDAVNALSEPGVPGAGVLA